MLTQKMFHGGQEVPHKFQYLPNCPVPLVGRDLLPKLQVKINCELEEDVTFNLAKSKTMVLTLTIPQAEDW